MRGEEDEAKTNRRGIKSMARKVVLYISVSLDGFIADEDGGVSWLGGQDREYSGDYGYSEFIEKVDTVIMGMNTYQQITTKLSPDKWVYPGIECYVVTHQPVSNNENVRFLSGEIREILPKLKEEQGKDIWICGGALLVNQVIKENLIDEYHITIMPIVLGSGIRLFEDNNPTKRLELEKVVTENGVVDIIYSMRKEE